MTPERLGDWYEHLKTSLDAATPHIKNAFQKSAEAGMMVWPEKDDRFHAFAKTPPKKVDVVLLGDGVLPGSTGLCFGTKTHTAYSEKIRLALAEARWSEGHKFDPHMEFDPDLGTWPLKGILCLSTSLTKAWDRTGAVSQSHAGAWRQVVKDTVRTLNLLEQPIVFIAMDAEAKDLLVENVTFKKDGSRVILATGDIHEAVRENKDWNHKNCFWGTSYFLQKFGSGFDGFDNLPF